MIFARKNKPLYCKKMKKIKKRRSQCLLSDSVNHLLSLEIYCDLINGTPGLCSSARAAEPRIEKVLLKVVFRLCLEFIGFGLNQEKKIVVIGECSQTVTTGAK